MDIPVASILHLITAVTWLAYLCKVKLIDISKPLAEYMHLAGSLGELAKGHISSGWSKEACFFLER